MSAAEDIRDRAIQAANDEYQRSISAAEAADRGIANAVTLLDHYSATIELRIAELQPQYGLVQLNAYRGKSDTLVSCDINRESFIAAVEQVLDVDITPRSKS